jgi:AbrB family looped-hinge helix DNA binding protein
MPVHLMKNDNKLLTTTFTTKGQVVIPKKIRTKLAIQEGTVATVYEDNGRIILQPVNESFIGGLRGMYADLPLVETLEADRGKERKPGI